MADSLESARTSTAPAGADDAQSAPRKRPPFWVGLVFVLLLGGGYVVTQYITYSGPAIAWRYEFAEALAEANAQDPKRRVFLLLHEPGCLVTQANERELFSTRFVRERLAKMVPCRVALRPDDPLRRQFAVTDQPVMLCIDPSGLPIGRVEGRADERMFRTNIHPD